MSNTFVLVDTKSRKPVFVSSSARKCKKEFQEGYRIEVWSCNRLVETIYNRNINDINKCVRLEKEYIAMKQKRAEERNKRRKAKLAMAV